jgi:hypothetical protein
MDIDQHLNPIRTTALLLNLCVYILLVGCQQKTSQENTTVKEDHQELPADFLEFYRMFHSDSGYQMSHITFPLQGITLDTAWRDSSVLWTSNKWSLHHPVIPDEFWELDFTMPMKNIVVEFIYAKQGGYWMERRFAKMDDNWYLIYYSDLKESKSMKNEE